MKKHQLITGFLLGFTALVLLGAASVDKIGKFQSIQLGSGTNTITVTEDELLLDGSVIGGGTTINSTDGYIPYRSSSTAFGNSPFYRISSTRLGFSATTPFLLFDIDTSNIAIGDRAMTNTPPTAANNIAIGLTAMKNPSSSAGGNVFIGSEAGLSLTEGDENTGVGYLAGQSLTTGEQNVAIGGSALISVATGTDNTAVGQASLGGATGSDNTAIGSSAGVSVSSGTGTTTVGAFADVVPGTLTNATAIGYNAVATGDNQMVFGAAVEQYLFGDGSTAPSLIIKQAGSEPAAPAAGFCKLFAIDNGSGKMLLRVRFPTGASQTIATQP